MNEDRKHNLLAWLLILSAVVILILGSLSIAWVLLVWR